MNDSHTSELLSAYLDNEISASEQAEVEQLLERDPQARQLLEELAQLGELLRNQPPQRVASGFASGVMNRVRQQPAHGQEPRPESTAPPSPTSAATTAYQADQQPATTGGVHVTLPSREDHALAGGNRRRQVWIWGAVAAAAALLLLAYPLGWFNFSGGPVPNRIAVEEHENGGEAIAEDHPAEQLPPETSGGNDPVENLAGREQDTSPRIRAPNTPGGATIIPAESLVDIPGSDSLPPMPGGSNSVSPFVGGGNFTAEDAKVLRLLESLVLVKIECTPAAAKAREFDKILKKFKIKVAEKATPPRPDNAPPPVTEVYYVEASAAQAEGVLNEVNARNTEFTLIGMRTETMQTQNTLNGNSSQEQPPSSEPSPAGQPNAADRDAGSAPGQAQTGRGSFAERLLPETPAELDALRNQQGQPASSSAMAPFLQGQSDLDRILGESPVNAEHVVRMLIVLDTVDRKKVE